MKLRIHYKMKLLRLDKPGHSHIGTHTDVLLTSLILVGFPLNIWCDEDILVKDVPTLPSVFVIRSDYRDVRPAVLEHEVRE